MSPIWSVSNARIRSCLVQDKQLCWHILPNKSLWCHCPPRDSHWMLKASCLHLLSPLVFQRLEEHGCQRTVGCKSLNCIGQHGVFWMLFCVSFLWSLKSDCFWRFWSIKDFIPENKVLTFWKLVLTQGIVWQWLVLPPLTWYLDACCVSCLSIQPCWCRTESWGPHPFFSILQHFSSFPCLQSLYLMVPLGQWRILQISSYLAQISAMDVLSRVFWSLPSPRIQTVCVDVYKEMQRCKEEPDGTGASIIATLFISCTPMRLWVTFIRAWSCAKLWWKREVGPQNIRVMLQMMVCSSLTLKGFCWCQPVPQ